uniref:ParE toxin of type II toxin-antitoxin system, parDE n=1 Tax=Candidatus Kentrum sp. FM TaxID=2126340 RepID=A0A450TPI3_9GAMM|nr:MAG: hypothetical protein BECKFM1743C_GA0114222_105115 [Candidatus Kentron sp. FM]VFJ69870.1 MAG: hypothetical protein BECKFM1743A_GA0114220_105255 [Candidatus Kentron sp. FM]VFK17790.1 MAG: hypothetical protein BECKFM1743B_GA0114221_105025 [Candidatus Kentron sp. FM]
MSAVDFDPDARAEFLAAMEYYEACQPGLGRRFRLAIESELDRIREMPSDFVCFTPRSDVVLFENFHTPSSFPLNPDSF